MNIVDLSEFNQQRRRNAAPPKTLLKQAQSGKIPGAFQYYPHGKWLVDLDVHDRAVREAAEAIENDNQGEQSPEQEAATLDAIWEDFCRAGQENA